MVHKVAKGDLVQLLPWVLNSGFLYKISNIVKLYWNTGNYIANGNVVSITHGLHQTAWYGFENVKFTMQVPVFDQLLTIFTATGWIKTFIHFKSIRCFLIFISISVWDKSIQKSSWLLWLGPPWGDQVDVLMQSRSFLIIRKVIYITVPKLHIVWHLSQFYALSSPEIL